MLRGINRAQLFYDDDDRMAFLDRLARYKEKCGFSLLAWCLMSNHCHLLVREGDVPLPTIMKKLELSYSRYFNAKYDWRGYLFQDRYKSKPVDSETYLLAVVRYIHRNPLEAGASLTTWTSYEEYLSQPKITDTVMVLEMLSSDSKTQHLAFKELIEFSEDSACSFLDNDDVRRIGDKEAIGMILEVGGLTVCAGLCLMEKGARDQAIVLLRNKGLSVRQIARLTGLSKSLVAKARV